MVRTPREFEMDGIYHVFNRGYEKRKIFFDNADYQRFVEGLNLFNNKKTIKIRDTRKNTDPTPTGPTGLEKVPIVELLAYALMPNHFHLVIREIVENGISLFMKKLGIGYTGYFNTRYERLGVGGIFQSRYKSVRITTDTQLQVIFAYVHSNPVELVERRWKDYKVKDPTRAFDWLESYVWSSFPAYLNGTKSEIVSTHFYNEFLGGSAQCQNLLKEWIEYKAGQQMGEIKSLALE